MNMKAPFWLLMLAVVFSVTAAKAQPGPQPDMELLLAQTEQLEFSVHYGFLTLGWVTIEPVKDTLYNQQEAYTFRTVIKANPSIPFMGRQERHYHSVFSATPDSLYGLSFWTHNHSKGEYFDSRYEYDYEAGKVYVYEFETPMDTLALNRAADSGPLLFFLTRLYAGLDVNNEFPIYISGEQGNVEMEYSSNIDRINIPAFGNVDAYYSSGDAHVDGPFGFSGYYKAWHKADSLRVPLEAHVRVWIGNVKVRLISFERYD